MISIFRKAMTTAAFIGWAALSATGAHAADAALIEAAKKEGQLVWYTTLIVNQAVRPIIQAFETKYPGIKVRYSRGDSGPTALKILNEARANALQADVFDGINTSPPLLKAGLVGKYIPAAAKDYPPELKDPEGHWIATNLYFFTPGVNTRLVKDGMPKTYQDLLDPKWKGKMAWTANPPAGSPIFVGNILHMMGQDKGMAYLKELAKQNVINVNATARAILDQVITGEYPMAVVIFNHHAELSAAKGAPVTWLKLEPVPATLSVTGLLKNAPHPNAAKLFIEFISSEEGQKVLADVNYLPAMPGVPAKVPALKPKEGNFKAFFMPPDMLADDMPKWTKIAHEIFP